MDKQPTTMDEIVADIKDTVERIGANLESEEDWMPVLLLYGEKPSIIGIPMMGEPTMKDLFAQKVIPELIESAKPDFAGLITMGWMKQYSTATLEDVAEQARDEAMFEPGNIVDRPGKSECLVIFVVGKNNEEHQLMAYVHRFPSGAPTLEWFLDSALDIPKDRSAGRFPDGLRAGMEAAWKPKS